MVRKTEDGSWVGARGELHATPDAARASLRESGDPRGPVTIGALTAQVGLSETASRTVAWTIALAAHGPSSPVDSTLLFAGLLAHADGDPSNTAGFLRAVVEARGATFDVEGALRAFGWPAPTEVRRLAADPPPLPRDRFAPSFWATLDVASAIGEQTRSPGSQRSEVYNRHLLAALLVNPPEDERFTRLLERLRLDAGQLRVNLLDFVEERFVPSHDAAAPWRTVLVEGLVNGAVASYSAESVDGKDALGVQEEAEALARLIASAEITPPLSVGLFGPWGSGKSFFMRLLRDHIDMLSRHPPDLAGRYAWCRRVVHVQFNAWHYTDANLWASLASHIFDRLGHALDEAPNVRKQLTEELRICRSEVESARARHAEALFAKGAAEADVEARRRTRESAVAEVEEAIRRSESIQGALLRASKALGIEVPVTQADELVREFSRARGVLSRAYSIWKRARARRQVITAAVLVGGPAAIAFLVQRLLDDGVPARWWSAGAGLLSLVGGAWAQTRLWLGRAIEAVEELTAEADRALHGADAARQAVVSRVAGELRDKKARVAALDAEVKEADRRVAVKEAEAARLERELEALAPGRVLERIVRERVSSGDYRRQLGIISLIQADFERLSTLLRESREEGDPGRIDRIVLYIDDLDRCSPAQVREVLQAVHLLLAFPLFVCVVGVDPRWVIHALEERGDPSGISRQTSTPIQYLEKIFQIPFAIPEFGQFGFVGLVNSLADGAKSARRSISGAAHLPDAPTMGAVPGDDSEAPVVGTASVDAAAAAGRDPGSSDLGLQGAPAPRLLDVEPLRLSPHELETICLLHPLIDSPRATKRLVNLYHLLRASVSGTDAARFMSEHGRDAAAAQVLLGVLCGFPEEAETLFAGITRLTSAVPLREVAGRLKSVANPPGGRPSPRLLAALDATASSMSAELSTDHLKAWIPKVRRYSLHGVVVRARERSSDEGLAAKTVEA